MAKAKKKEVEETAEKYEKSDKEKSEKSEKTDSKAEKIKAEFNDDRVLTEISDQSRELYNQSRYGTLLENGKVQLSLLEALYLIEKNKIAISKNKNKEFTAEEFVKKAKKSEPNLWVRYCVYKDIRNRGYIIKTALKFGADFRVYDRGVKPGEDHARWIIYPVYEANTLTWYEFAAKNRVAHSTRKRILIAVVDEENDVSYWEVRWMRP